MNCALRNGRTDAGAPISLTLRDGLITDLEPPVDMPGIDLGGRLLIPGMIDSHVHLDKTLLSRDWLPFSGAATVANRVATEKRIRQSLEWDIAAQGDALLHRMVAAGTTTLRTHVDIDDVVGLRNLEQVLALRASWADRVTIQIVAFPQSGILRCPGMPGLLHEALSLGADLIGGLDPIGFDGDMDGQLDIVFGLAERHGKPVDIHLHDGGAPGLLELSAIAERTDALGMTGRVMVSHAFALGEAPPDDFARVAALLARAGISIMTSVPGDRAIPPISALAAAGVNLCLGSDNVRDVWSPMTVISMVERAMLAAYRSGFRADEELRTCLDLAITNGAKALGLTPRVLSPGAPADLIAIDVPHIPAAVVERAAPDLVMRAGIVVVNRLKEMEGGFP